jgi:hypothetical protein
MQIASGFSNALSTFCIQKRPIRTDDAIEIATNDEAEHELKMGWDALREEDQPFPPPMLKAAQTMQEVLLQAPPRAKLRRIPVTWEIKRPSPEESMRQGDQVLVILDEIAGIQDLHQIFRQTLQSLCITASIIDVARPEWSVALQLVQPRAFHPIPQT